MGGCDRGRYLRNNCSEDCGARVRCREWSRSEKVVEQEDLGVHELSGAAEV